ncbi:MAG TPA: hypothetical protein VGL63_16965 [Streptosporangiaceae bacterium]|jgi:hypothetical protein
MSAPTRTDEPGLSRRDEAAVSSAAMSAAPWTAAVGTGAVVGLGDLGLHLISGNIGLSALSGSAALGVLAFFVVAAAGALQSSRSGRALRWARSNPWRFAILPGAACAAIVFVLSVVLGGGVFAGIFSGVWHGAGVYGLTGLAGSMGGARRRRDA